MSSLLPVNTKLAFTVTNHAYGFRYYASKQFFIIERVIRYAITVKESVIGSKVWVFRFRLLLTVSSIHDRNIPTIFDQNILSIFVEIIRRRQYRYIIEFFWSYEV